MGTYTLIGGIAAVLIAIWRVYTMGQEAANATNQRQLHEQDKELAKRVKDSVNAGDTVRRRKLRDDDGYKRGL